jgi:hypothetical protein
MEKLLTTLIGESDRGAVLLGGIHVDKYMRGLLEAVMPQDLSQERRKQLLNYPGPLASFSARIDVAYATRLISRPLYDALHALRPNAERCGP